MELAIDNNLILQSNPAKLLQTNSNSCFVSSSTGWGSRLLRRREQKEEAARTPTPHHYCDY